jgi:hypothetical protein
MSIILLSLAMLSFLALAGGAIYLGVREDKEGKTEKR